MFGRGAGSQVYVGLEPEIRMCGRNCMVIRFGAKPTGFGWRIIGISTVHSMVRAVFPSPVLDCGRSANIET